ncbi:hypothetical protein [Methylobacterium sp. WL120]|uniref:hypothetical protein n=1 Tax=Methylobacterium sp. WL120 TaxID=2603887 RepID=UPI0011CAE520|nr:hypothetical protein [Methylobacterium sp. WL120]TXM64606.1 hypothetical protein FV229_18105 [Methylobacterium sp. WL120]
MLKVLPTAAYNLIGSEELTGIADLVVRTIDETREARLLDPTADRRSEAHEWVASLATAGIVQRDQLSARPSAAAQSEYEALRDMIDGHTQSDDPPGPSIV